MTETSDAKAQMQVDLISACAAVDACEAPPKETLDDLALPAASRQAVLVYCEEHEHHAIPSADMLLQTDVSGFVSALAVMLVPGEWREKRRLAVVARPFGFVTKLGKERVAIIAPARFETDFASIPPAARWLISSFGRHAEAAVIHDWLYALGPKGDRKARRRADRIFSIALKGVGIGFFKRTIMFCAVRVGGGSSFGGREELNFRELGSLTPVHPAPKRAPYARTIATSTKQKPKQA